jgi:DNA segregation ATPase FtsK/SpoIIIE, S-DNA-T family
MGALALVPKSNNDKKKINKIFENVGYGIRSKSGDIIYPKFKKKRNIYESYFCHECGSEFEGYTEYCDSKMCKGQKQPVEGINQIAVEYWYTIPLGLPASKLAKTEKEGKIFEDGLKKPIKVSYEDYLKIRVYHSKLPKLVKYKDMKKIKHKWLAPMGISLDGTIWRDFDAIPHMIIAGTTRFGKTVALKLLMTYLIENHPNDIDLYIIDLKGGLEFSRYENLKQVKGVASNIEEAHDLLFKLANSQPYVDVGKGKDKHRIFLELGTMIKEYQHFRKNKWANIVDTPIKKRTFVIIDEAAQLTPEKWMSDENKRLMGACQSYLSEIARLGGALGYREVFCTQYPTSDTLPRQIKMTSDVKMTFRLGTSYASEVAIDDKGAEELPTTLKGRALYKTHEVEEIQVPYISDDEMYSRLNKYQDVVVWEGEVDNVIEEDDTSRGDTKHSTDSGVCDTFTITSHTRFEK